MCVNTLAFRNGEQANYFTDEPSDEVQGERYQVCLHPVDVLPQPWSGQDGIYPYTVLCAARYPEKDGAWAWVALDFSTKQDIGMALEEWIGMGEIAKGQWVWMVVIPSYLR